ncbi:MAG: Flp family type IVb pilin [bacterium]
MLKCKSTNWKRYSRYIKQFHLDEQGATAVEWGLVCLLISIAVIGTMQAVGTSVSTMYSDMSSEVSTAM